MSQTATHSIRLAIALRDFFSADCATGLASAVPGIITGKELSEAEAQELDFEFNRLFVGPDAVPAPLFASVYLEKEPQLMGRTTLEVRELYLGLGLSVPEGGTPDDFLPYELDAWVHLSVLEDGASDAEALSTLREARCWLVQEHMAQWLPAFMARVSHASPSPLMADIVKTLENWLHAAKENV